MKIDEAKIEELESFVSDARGTRNHLKKTVDKAKETIAHLEHEVKSAEQARDEIQKVDQRTKKGLQIHFGNVVTSALETVGMTDYKFRPIFEKRRNKTECDMMLEKDGKLFKPTNKVGGGVLDTCSFALRIALWKLENTAPVLLFDEPFKMASEGYLPQISTMMEEIQQEFNMQIIMATHHKELECGDKFFYMEKGEVR